MQHVVVFMSFSEVCVNDKCFGSKLEPPDALLVSYGSPLVYGAYSPHEYACVI